MGDSNAAFRLASNLKTAWLGSTCQGTTNVIAVLLLLASHNTAKLLHKRWKSDVWPAWSEIL